MAQLNPQIDMFKKSFAKKPDRFGGNQRTTRASRRFRPVSTTKSMHLILKSKLAKGPWSFLTAPNKRIIKNLITAFAQRYSVQILSAVNVGNHIHIHLKVKRTHAYKSFVRALTGAIALKVTGSSKLKKLKQKFWTQTPYTRFVHSLTDFLKLRDYLRVNILEGFGVPRFQAEFMIRNYEWPGGA